MSHSVSYGAAVTVSIEVQVPAPAGETWNSTEATSGSVGEASRWTGPLRTVPGSRAGPLGGVVSITTAAVFCASTLPAASVDQ